MKKNRDQVSGVGDQATVTEVREIEVDRLFLSPAETRKTMDQAALSGLAQSIAKDGVIEPLLVRPGAGALVGRFEIVAGQRRWLASKLARKATCPCTVREMSDAEAAELRIISNLQREDLPPLEEALAFAALLNVPGATVETVAAKLAKSASYVGRRLQLLKAVEPVREALKAGAIEVGHALELARLDEKQQIRHLSRLNCGYVCSKPELDRFDEDAQQEIAADWDSGDGPDDADGDAPELPVADRAKSQWRPTDASVAELRKEIARTTLRVLTDAPFPLEDELPPMACTECPKRSGNAVLLFDDCAQDTCTDRDCFDAKIGFWIQAELDLAKDQKRKLLKLADTWSSDKAAIGVASYNGVHLFKSEHECPHGEEGIWLDGKRAGHRATICRNQDCKTHHAGKNRDQGLGVRGQGNERSAARKKLLAKVRDEKAYRVALFKAIANVKISVVATSMTVALVDYAIKRSDGTLRQKAVELMGWDKALFQGYGDAAGERRRSHLAQLSGAEAVRAGLLFSESSELSVREYAIDSKPTGLESLARMFGVDPKAVRATSTKPAKAMPAKVQKKPVAKAVPKKAAKPVAKKPAKKQLAKKAAKR